MDMTPPQRSSAIRKALAGRFKCDKLTVNHQRPESLISISNGMKPTIRIQFHGNLDENEANLPYHDAVMQILQSAGIDLGEYEVEVNPHIINNLAS